MNDAITHRRDSDPGPPVGEIISAMLAHGRDLSVFDGTFLARSLERRLGLASPNDLAAYLRGLLEDPAEADAFFHSLIIGHTCFFRDPLAFALLEQRILPDLMAARAATATGPRELRVWSAGCADGQEAWSVAILLEELAAAKGPPMAYRILATDLCEPRLARATSGVYASEEVGNVRARHLRKHFTEADGTFRVAAGLRDNVAFSAFDLLNARSHTPAESIYGGFDLILCCNVLLYYRGEAQDFILDKLRRGLAPGGYLVVDATERPIVERAGGLRATAPPVAVFQKRQ